MGEIKSIQIGFPLISVQEQPLVIFDILFFDYPLVLVSNISCLHTVQLT